LIRLIAEPNECANLNYQIKAHYGKHKSIISKQATDALVTGANQGVGFQIAKALGAQGYTVYVGARNLSNGEKAAAEIEQEHGRLDLLVNNAGVSHSGKVTEGRSLGHASTSTSFMALPKPQ